MKRLIKFYTIFKSTSLTKKLIGTGLSIFVFANILDFAERNSFIYLRIIVLFTILFLLIIFLVLIIKSFIKEVKSSIKDTKDNLSKAKEMIKGGK